MRDKPRYKFLLFFPKSVQAAFKTGFSISILSSALAGLSFIFFQPVIPLFYSLAQPEKQLQPKIWIFFYPVLNWIIFLIHLSILSKSRNLAISIQKIFSWSTTGIIVLLTILLIRTMVILL